MRRRTPLIPVTLAAVSLVATAFAPAANAATPEDVVGGLVTPLSVAVSDSGTVYASQNFAGMLTKKAPGQDAEVVHEAQGNEVGAVSVSGDVVTFATTGMGPKPSAKVWTLGAEGTATAIANLWGYEKKNNPDGIRKYGVAGLGKSCIASIPKKVRQGLVAYKGIQESHPYATYVADGTTFVADAAANAIFRVTDEGVSTVAVLPATKIEITRKIRKAFDLPRCVQGKTYRAEAVPTDVEMGPDGNLYVTSLPGGPDDPAMGANGSIYKIVPGTGRVSKMSGGLVSPTGLAIGPDGTAYISMLFASTVLAVPLGGKPAPFAEVPFPGDVEVKGGHVYVTETDLMNDGTSSPAGKVLRFPVAG